MLINNEVGEVNNVYKNLKTMEEIIETKMTHGAHDIIAVASQNEELESPKELHQKIKKLHGVKDLTSIHDIKDEFLKNVAE